MNNVISDEEGVKLHHRKVLEKNLTPEDTALLEAWYAKHDQIEAASLKQLKPSLAELETEVVALLKKVVEQEKHNQEIAARNAVLQAEIEIMKKELKKRRPDIYAELARAAEAV